MSFLVLKRMTMYSSWSLRYLDTFPFHFILKKVYDVGYLYSDHCVYLLPCPLVLISKYL